MSLQTDTATLPSMLARFPRERTWLLPALHAAQEACGHLSESTLATVAAHLRVPASEVYGVATGYPEFRLTPRGRHHVRYCTGVTCRLLGGGALQAILERRFGTAPGDGQGAPEVTLEAADCFFACSVAPLVEVDGVYRGRVSEAQAATVERWFTDTSAPTAPTAHAAPVLGRATPSRTEHAAATTASLALGRLVEAARARRSARPALRVTVHGGSCARAVGAEPLLAALRAEVARRGLDAEVVDGACDGACWAAPAVTIEREGWPRAALHRVGERDVAALVDLLAGEAGAFTGARLSGVVDAERAWRGLEPRASQPFWSGQERVLLSRCGAIDPMDLDDALLAGAYGALARALDGAPGDVLAAVKAAGLQGRGGAFFPTAVKWEACARAAGTPKYIVMNGEEGEPGIFKDRHLLEGDPHQALEGVLLAAWVTGAGRAIVYVHGEAHLAAERLAQAVAQARAAGLVGARILGRDFECEVELRRGAGGFVLGEETALLESIEGRRAQPRTRPPFPVEAGLWGKPTVINNVETLSAIPWIVTKGGAWFAALGTARAPGTKVFGLSGPIQRPGVVEVRNGVTLAALLEGIGGGLTTGGGYRGAVVGGPSGTIVPAALFDVAMAPRERVSPGTGGVVALPASVSVVDVLTTLLRFNAAESCGKCTPCREGAPRLLAMLGDMGQGREPAARVRELADAVRAASLCGLGQAAPLALLAALDEFPDELGLADVNPRRP